MKNPLRYQFSEYDCGPTSMQNAVSFLFEREEIPAEILRNIMLYCLDCYGQDGTPGQRGTSCAAMMFLSNWLNSMGDIGKLDITSKYLSGKDVYIGKESYLNDAADPVCYSFYSEEGAKASIATDLGDYDEYLVEKIYDSDILFVEANHDVNMLQVGRYPYYLKRRILGKQGHLSNERCAELIEEVATPKTKKVYLGHLSKENNYEKLAYETVKIFLHNFTLPIEVARRDTVSTVTSVS